MDGLLRRMPIFLLAFALLGATLVPAAAQAASPSRALPRTVQWSPNTIRRQVTAGAYHETFIATRFYAPTAIAPRDGWAATSGLAAGCGARRRATTTMMGAHSTSSCASCALVTRAPRPPSSTGSRPIA